MLDAGGGIVGIPSDVAAHHVEEAEGAVAVVEEGIVARPVHEHDRLVRMLGNGLLESCGDFIECRLPGNPLELSLSAPADALHRELQALLRIETLPNRAPALAGPHLRTA